MPERIKLEPTDPRYPPRLRDASSDPPALRVDGDASLLARLDLVAVCGARKCAPYGVICAEATGRTVADADMMLLSGGAVGVQTHAIEAALEHGGQCIVMLGSGLNNPYPQGNAELFRRVVDAGGAVVSPYPDDMPPRPVNFRTRNNLIVHASLCLVVAEAGLPSGTYSMADSACGSSRPVLAWPGQAFSPQSAGSNAMIASGTATCIDCIDTLSERLHLIRDNMP